MLRHLTGPKLAALCLLLLLAAPARATQHVVIPGGAGIQTVIDQAAAGDTLLLLGQFSGPENRNLDPQGKDLVYLGAAEATVLDGETESIFRFLSGETSATLVRNLTLVGAAEAVVCAGVSEPSLEQVLFTENFGTAGGSPGGAALRCEDQAAPRVENCVFTGNAHTVGGAVALLGTGAPLFLDCEFILNDAAWGGAVFVGGGDPRFERSTFRWNSAYPMSDDLGGDGGALLVTGGRVELVELLAESNQALAVAASPDEGGHGGFVCVRGSGEVLLESSTVVDHLAERAGGAIYLAESALATASQTLLAGNAPDGCHGADAAALAITCSDVFSDAGPAYAGTLPDATGVGGNLDVDPIFCGGVAPGQPWGLHEDSPCLPGNNGCGLLMGLFGLACMGDMSVHEVPAEFATIQAAIDVAADGDTVLVAPGLYRGDGNRALTLGGKAIVLRSTGGAGTTFIDCEGAGRGLNCVSGETAATVIEGFTIYGGLESSGGALLCVNSAPTFRDLVIASNTATGAGGGGVTCVDASPLFTDVRISNNDAAGDGGGLLLLGDSSPLLETVRLYDNSAAGDGGALHVSAGQPSLTRCTLAFNAAAGEGGAIMGLAGALVDLNTSLVVFNLDGGGLAAQVPGTFQVSCSDAYGNTGGDWVGAAVDPTGSDGNIANDPLFCGPETRDLSLDADSPCLPANNACSLRMGALGEGCDLEHLRIGGILAESDGTPVADVIMAGIYFEARSLADGSYLIHVPRFWSGTLRPAHVDYVFQPASRDYESVDEDLLAEDYLATRTTLRHVPSGYPDIQSALTASQDGDTVLVAQGTYTGGGNKSLDFGGRDIVLIGANGPDETIIDLEQAGRAFDFDDGESPAAVVDGFTIRQGHVFYDWESNSGGGIRIVGSSPTLRNLVIEDCRSKGAGGGLVMADSESMIEDIVLARNEAYGVSTGRGGALAAFGGSPRFERLLIQENVAMEGGGGFFGSATLAQLGRSTLVGNQAARGGGICLESGSLPRFENLLLASNAAPNGSAVHAADAGSQPDWSCSDFFGHAGSEFGGHAAWPGGDSFSADPLFCDPGAGNYTLAAQSPCLAENNDCGEDVGALGLGCTLTAQGEAPVSFRLAQNRPNPFNPSTELRFTLDAAERVSLEIFDLGGRRVTTLIADRLLPSGEHSLRWTARDLSSGVYLLRLRAGERSRCRKLTLLK